MSLSKVRRIFLLAALSLSPAAGYAAAPWLPYGPDGGDARAFAMDPSNHEHLFMGTANGWIYQSLDSGAHWLRLARVGKRDDLVLDHVIVDAQNPKHVIVGAWVLDHPDGGIFQSYDGGATWIIQPQMKGQSIRALREAPSDPKIIVAGTLDGIYRSVDSGAHWNLISPPDSPEIHNFQSIAIAPDNPGIIYGGTRHLPWKTPDAGVSWVPVKKGIIDDSDVFSIIIDPQNPNVIYASACSGIYKSENSGGDFKKVQGIPSSARRTRVLMQDPQHLETVFAGTTEGLWRTNDSGQQWTRTTGPEVIVNDVFIDPTNTRHVLIATDRGGVLVSEDGGDSFSPSNRGFSARFITSLMVDPHRLGTMYVGLANDKEWGGVFMSRDGGLTWNQRSDGLRGRDVFSLAQAPDGATVAGTSHGIFRFESGFWNQGFNETLLGTPAAPRRPVAAKPVTRSRVVIVKGKKVVVHETVKPKSAAVAPPVDYSNIGTTFDGVAHAIATVGLKMFAGSSRGMLVSANSGQSWNPVPALADEEWRFLAADKQNIVAASLQRMVFSVDGGATWKDMLVPPKIMQISALAVDGKGEIWCGGREGVYLSPDHGMSWQTLENLYVHDVDSLYYDANLDRVLVTTSGNTPFAYAVNVTTRGVSYWETGWTLRFMRPMGDHLLGATLFDGIVIQPRMVDSKEQATAVRVGAGGGGE